MKCLRQVLLIMISSITIMLSGCISHTPYNQTLDNVNNIQSQLNDISTNKITEQYQDNHYILNAGNAGHSKPAWMKQPIVINAQQVPFHVIVEQLLSQSNINVIYGTDIDINAPVSLRFKGSVKEALQYLTEKTNYAYTINGNVVTWSTVIVKTFEINFLPGKSSFTTNNQKGSTDVWTDLQNNLKDFLSKDGKIYISESLTMLTVRDHPNNVHAISEFIKKVNENLGRQVLIKVAILEIQLDKYYEQGIDWQLVGKFFNQIGQFSLSGNFGSLIEAPNTATIGTVVGTMDKGFLSGSQAIIKALEQQGNVSIVTRPTAITLNNQAAVLKINKDTSYLAKIQSTTTADTKSVETSVTPGKVQEGLTMTLVPKIYDNKIYLQIDTNMSSLQKLEKHAISGSTAVELETPIITDRTFTQKAIIPSGSTLILAGFKQTKDTANDAALFGSSALGGEGAVRSTNEIVILITPYIAGKQKQDDIAILAPETAAQINGVTASKDSETTAPQVVQFIKPLKKAPEIKAKISTEPMKTYIQQVKPQSNNPISPEKLPAANIASIDVKPATQETKQPTAPEPQIAKPIDDFNTALKELSAPENPPPPQAVTQQKDVLNQNTTTENKSDPHVAKPIHDFEAALKELMKNNPSEKT